jgi:hypothetical protein
MVKTRLPISMTEACRMELAPLIFERFELYDRDVGGRLAEIFCISLL